MNDLPEPTSLRVDRTLYTRLLAISHELEIKEERRISMNEVIEFMLNERTAYQDIVLQRKKRKKERK